MASNNSIFSAWELLPTARIGPSFVLFTLIAFLYYATYSVRAYYRLAHIKGPTLAAWMNLPWYTAAVSGTPHLWLSGVSSKYGPISRIGPNTILSCDEELFRSMNTFRYNGKFEKTEWYKAFKFDADNDNLFSTIDEQKHVYLRTRLTPGYSGKDNPDLEPDIDSIVWALIRLIRSKYISCGPSLKMMDFAALAQYFTLDVITVVSLGEPIGFVKDDEDKYEYVATIENNFPAMNLFAVIPPLRNFMQIPAVQRLALPTVKDKTGMGALKQKANEIIAKRFGDDKEIREDMTGSFIQHGLTQAEIADESMLQILAGSDTTATAIRTGFIQIVTNPSVYKRLTAECRKAEVPVSDIISNAEALQLPYLQACCKEALRHNPPATGLLPRVVVAREGVTHKGIFIPHGTEIGLCAWNSHRLNTATYGEDAAVFRPERWLEGTAEKLVEMDKSAELVFGYGRFRCMGETIAKIELNKLFFELFRRFDWSLVDPLMPLEKSNNYGLFIQKGMWVRVTELE